MTKAHERRLSRDSQAAGAARACPDPSICPTCPGRSTCIYLQNQSRRRFLTELLTLVERRVSIGSDLLSVHTAARVLSERVQEGPAGVTKTTRVAKMIVETMDKIRATQWGQSISDYRAEKWHMGRPSRVIYSVDQSTVESLRWYLEHFDQSQAPEPSTHETPMAEAEHCKRLHFSSELPQDPTHGLDSTSDEIVVEDVKRLTFSSELPQDPRVSPAFDIHDHTDPPASVEMENMARAISRREPSSASEPGPSEPSTPENSPSTSDRREDASTSTLSPSMDETTQLSVHPQTQDSADQTLDLLIKTVEALSHCLDQIERLNDLCRSNLSTLEGLELRLKVLEGSVKSQSPETKKRQLRKPESAPQEDEP